MMKIRLEGGPEELDGKEVEVVKPPTFLSFPIAAPILITKNKVASRPEPGDLVIYRRVEMDKTRYVPVLSPQTNDEYQRYKIVSTIEDPDARAKAMEAEGFD